MYFHNKDNIESGSSVIISGKYPPPPTPGEEISPNVIWGKIYDKDKRKRGQCKRKGRKGKKRKWEVKG